MSASRNAIVLSLGMLLERVNTDVFIQAILKTAKEENPAFEFTQSLQMRAFLLSDQFNKGEIEPENYEAEILTLLGIKTITSEIFWSEWRKIVLLGNISEKISLLQRVGEAENAIFYLCGDTNKMHLKCIAEECNSQGITLATERFPAQLAQYPLYTSFGTGKSRFDLIKHVIGEIKEKVFNNPENIILILGNTDNIRNELQRAKEAKSQEPIVAWCRENEVKVTFHTNSLEETLNMYFSLENKPATQQCGRQ